MRAKKNCRLLHIIKGTEIHAVITYNPESSVLQAMKNENLTFWTANSSYEVDLDERLVTRFSKRELQLILNSDILYSHIECDDYEDGLLGEDEFYTKKDHRCLFEIVEESNEAGN